MNKYTRSLSVMFCGCKVNHAEKVEVGQVPFLPFMSSSSALLQLSVEPCQRERGPDTTQGGQRSGWDEREGRETRRDSETNHSFNASVRRGSGGGLDTLPTRTQRQPDGQMDGWTGGRLPPRSTNQPGQQRGEARGATHARECVSQLNSCH